jgi:muconolactone delta-isomerase
MTTPAPIVITNKELAEYAFKELEWFDELRKKGELVFTAPYLGRRARVIILNVKSDKHLFQILNSDPQHNYSEKEVIPLSNDDDVRVLYEERYRKDSKKG